MAFTRQLYDSCATKKLADEGTGVLSYLMDPTKYYNCNPCRVQTGIVAGNDVSLYIGNMVDLESELKGHTRANTHCPSGKYLPGTVIQGQTGKAQLVHLPECNIVKHKPRPTVSYKLDYPECPSAYPAYKASRSKPSRKHKELSGLSGFAKY